MKISDYIMNFIAGLGVRHVFCVTGGGAMHLNDSLGTHKHLEGIFMLHEQGAAIAAEAYARIREGYGVCLVTSGPGGTNALTGLAGAYMDSIPVIFISGQVKREDLRDSQNVRQFGIQEVDILSMARSYTKYAVQIKDPQQIRYECEKAAAVAVHGRPGPVWLDIPLDIQAMQVCPEELRGYDNSVLPAYPAKEEAAAETINLLNQSRRPVVLLGHGIRLSHAAGQAVELCEQMGIPVLVSWNGVDLIEEEHPLYYGRPGTVGHRAANLILQKADFVLTIGSRLNLLSTGYCYEGFLRNAKHVMVDIDEHEMEKKSVHPYLKIACDAGDFIKKMLKMLRTQAGITDTDRAEWLRCCDRLWKDYPVFIPQQAAGDGYVSSYHLVHELSGLMTGEDLYQFTSSGTTVDIAMKAFRIKRGQRAFLTKGLAAMGYDIPSCVGSCIASGRRRTVCVTGDGSAAMNMQELEVIHRLRLPVKIFVAVNQGYGMIYGTQQGNFDGRLIGSTKESGLTLPDMKRVAEALGIKGMHIQNEDRLRQQIQEVLDYDGPVVCTYHADLAQKILPRQANYMREDGQMASRPLEDMVPLLDREELEECMRI
ncbi:MAG: thiamine pyrophosphate-binding protein [Eubacterium sp.]|nr:thiamine pyrophosphate-binding protein [Eubacterium sp.]